jgi:hypothetical protein
VRCSRISVISSLAVMPSCIHDCTVSFAACMSGLLSA